jgi:hypothetical protein
MLSKTRGLEEYHLAFAESCLRVEGPGELAIGDPGRATDLGAALGVASALVGPTGRAVLVSDGCHNRGPSPVAAARRVGIPVDVAVPWAVGETADLRVDEIAGREVVSVGDTLVARALVRWEALAEAESVVVRLEREGVVVDSVGFVAHSGWGEVLVSLAAAANREGSELWWVTAVGPRETVTGNNRRALEVRVVAGARVVGLIATAAHPDYAALRRSLEGDPSTALTGGVVDAGGRLTSPVETPQGLSEADVLVVIASPGSGLSAALCNTLAGWVRSGAKGLLWLGTTLPDCESLAALVPGSLPGPAEAVPARSVSYAAPVHPVVDGLAGDLNVLPPLTVGAPARALHGGSVALWCEEPRVPLLVVSTATGTRTAWLNTKTLWRWFLGEGEQAEFAHSLLDRLMAWLGQAGGPLRVSFAQAGDLLRVEASLYDPDWQPRTSSDLSVSIADTSGTPVATGSLGAEPGVPGLYRGQLGPLSAGKYRYAAEAQVQGIVVARSSGWIHVAPSTAEVSDVVPCTGLLRDIAQVTGGRYYGLEQLHDLITEPPAASRRPVTLCPWRGGWWALAALLLLATEWYLRRRTGLS